MADKDHWHRVGTMLQVEFGFLTSDMLWSPRSTGRAGGSVLIFPTDAAPLLGYPLCKGSLAGSGLKAEHGIEAEPLVQERA